MTKTQFARLLKKAMDDAGFKPSALAEAAKTSEQGIRVMTRSKSPSTPSILRAAEVLRVLGYRVQIIAPGGEVVEL